ncbi:hypothetical protein HK16_04000 [Acetobacter senegalensis]|uniref:Uncharacterized protein n=2 Tax=Acetobacter TaxID=434 RepID=A0A252EDU1_9PROT|nr:MULTISPECIES: hypothetical protein [Acetobacter]ATJ90406.1 hypothetical protein CIW82_06630 [Acetobacter tropicalis]OUL64587.1 hypothetical protein HK16_04000 [Acetobacter senegalensis]
MRTREEQIAALAFKIGGVQASNATHQSAEAHIIEAERRAEQRVRAETGRDSERLDWVADHQCQFENQLLGGSILRRVNDSSGDLLVACYDLREAIDTARELK